MYNCSILIVCLLAMSLSAYSVFVKYQAHQDENYEALCDINSKVNCTRVFNSEYGTGFGLKILPESLKLSNGYYGIAFYSLMAILSFVKCSKLVTFQLFLSSLSIVLSIYLAYVLYFILSDACVVCISTYILNVINTTLIYKKLQRIKSDRKKKIS